MEHDLYCTLTSCLVVIKGTQLNVGNHVGSEFNPQGRKKGQSMLQVMNILSIKDKSKHMDEVVL